MSYEESLDLSWWERTLRDSYLNIRYMELLHHPELAGIMRESAKRCLIGARRQTLQSLPPWMRLRAGTIIATGAGVSCLFVAAAYLHSDVLSLAAWFGFFVYVAVVATVRITCKRDVRKALDAILVKKRFDDCVSCDYNLRGSTSATCPECGAPITIEDWRNTSA